MEEKMVRILLVDDHMMVRQGLRFFLNSQDGLEIIGEAEDGIEAVKLAKSLKPDVILMDLKLPKLSGIEAIKLIRDVSDDIEILVLSSYIADDMVVQAIQNGATGYLMKDVKPSELSRAIFAAARGEVYLHPKAARFLAQSLRPQSNREVLPEALTDREMEVLRLVARGLSNKDIAQDLSISLKTVKAHVSNILQKLQLTSRVQAVIYALRQNIVPLQDEND